MSQATFTSQLLKYLSTIDIVVAIIVATRYSCSTYYRYLSTVYRTINNTFYNNST